MRTSASLRQFALLLFGLWLTMLPAMAMAEEKTVPPIDDLAWLSGTWVGEHFGDTAIATYHEPVGNTIAGAYQVVDASGQTTIIEFDLIERTEEGFHWHYRIFGPGMEPLDSPFGNAGTYRLEIVGPQALEFFDDTGKTAMKSSRVELQADGTMKTTIVLKSESGGADQTFELIAKPRD